MTFEQELATERELQSLRAQLSACQQQVSTLTAQLSRRTTEALQLAEQLSACQRENQRLIDIYQCPDDDYAPLLTNLLRWPKDRLERLTKALMDRTKVGTDCHDVRTIPDRIQRSIT